MYTGTLQGAGIHVNEIKTGSPRSLPGACLGLKPGYSPWTLVDSPGPACILDPCHIPIPSDSETLFLSTVCQVD